MSLTIVIFVEEQARKVDEDQARAGGTETHKLLVVQAKLLKHQPARPKEFESSEKKVPKEAGLEEAVQLR